MAVRADSGIAVCIFRPKDIGQDGDEQDEKTESEEIHHDAEAHPHLCFHISLSGASLLIPERSLTSKRERKHFRTECERDWSGTYTIKQGENDNRKGSDKTFSGVIVMYMEEATDGAQRKEHATEGDEKEKPTTTPVDKFICRNGEEEIS